jgi:hypothetical protein
MLNFFMNPVFLAGAAAAALPILIHLLSRRRFTRVRWAAMEFLLRAHRKTHRRLRIENLLVLLLRMTILALFAMALARPVLRQASVVADMGEKNRTVFLVLDNSFSMTLRRGETSPFENARRVADEVTAKLTSGSDSVALYLTSSLPFPLFEEPTPDVDRVREELGNILPSAGVTDFTPALTRIAQVLKNPQVRNAPNKSLYIITDLQRLGWVGGDRNLTTILDSLAEHMDAIHVVDVGREPTDNHAITTFESDDKIIGLDKPASFTVTVSNHTGVQADDLNVEFFVDGASRGNKSVSVSPRGSAGIHFTTVFRRPGAHRLRARLMSDALPTDNDRFLAVNVREKLRILLVDGEPEDENEDGFFGSETAYLKLALMPSDDEGGTEHSGLLKPEVCRYFEVSAETHFHTYQVVILANEGRLVNSDFEVVEALEAYVRAGGAVLIFLGDRIKPDDYNRHLFREGLGILPMRLTSILGRTQSLVSLHLDSFHHPIFSVFDDRELRKLVTAPYTTFFFGVDEESAPPDAKVIARFDDEGASPALVEKPLGHGRVLMVTTTCDREWTKIPANFVFLPLVHEMVYYLAHEALGHRNVRVGHIIERVLTQEEYSENVTLVLPTGGRPAVEPPQRQDHGRFLVSYGPVEEPGIYELTVDGEKATHEFFAANLDTTESDLDRISEEELTLVFPPAARSKLSILLGTSDAAQRPEVVGGSEFWRHFLVLIIILLALETILAQRFGNYAR